MAWYCQAISHKPVLTQIPAKHMASLGHKIKWEQDLRYWKCQANIVDIRVNNR